jgi:hypothetical protein
VQGLGCSNNLCPAEAVPVVVLRNRTGVLQGGNDIRPFFLRQEMRRFGGAREEEKRHHTKDRGKYAFLSRRMSVISEAFDVQYQNEYPGPPGLTTHSIELVDGSGQQTGESVSQ